MIDKLKKTILNNIHLLGRSGKIQNLIKPLRGIGAVLMYHRILPDDRMNRERYNERSIVSVTRFEEQMKYIAENYTVISMDELPAFLSDPLGFAVLVTFDDGYKDNQVHGLPILEKYNIPATIYIASSFPDSGKGMWWLELEELCQVGKPIRFNWKGTEISLDTRTEEACHRAFKRLVRLLLAVGLDDRESVLQDLREGQAAGIYPDQVMTWSEIREISENPLITIGSHTHFHLNVAMLKDEEAFGEIQKSKTIIEAQIGREVSHFAFPYGSPREPGEREFRFFEGYKTAATTRPLLLSARENLLSLPRIEITQDHDVSRLMARFYGIEDLVRNTYYRAVKIGRLLGKQSGGI